ncbi:E3 ubiquitin-protein ligase ATL42 [Arachis duranensis]|uniref:RING-type E3 ubiquitin transferase n=1 Tax=Arachis duranensis TaxID=130453 RepID=A0A6P4DDL3_ARADU|nr:E3 ubiquitin-protein ligase ATL42 [Arachis duranensis]
MKNINNNDNNKHGSIITLLLLVLISMLIQHVRAINPSSSSSGDAVSNFQPSLVVVIGILGLMFSLTFVLLVFAKFCQRGALVPLLQTENQENQLLSRSRRFSGIDKNVIESLPFFRFSSLKGSKEGLECSVCLSKFEDVEILRLLPKCKHAFHIDCIDHWLEKHASCPLCRHKVNPADESIFAYSNSLRRLVINNSAADEDSNMELFVQREEEEEGGEAERRGSTRFSIGSISLRRLFSKDVKEEELPIQNRTDCENKEYHKHKHRITVSDVVFKNRWSNVSSSDIMFLNSEMLNEVSSCRFDNQNANDQGILNLKEEMERKISFESKIGAINKINNSNSDKAPSSSSSSTSIKHLMNEHSEKRSMSEIIGVSRFGEIGMMMKQQNRAFNKDSSSLIDENNNMKEERMRQLWFPIARRTVQWFVNRETRSHHKNNQKTLDV